MNIDKKWMEKYKLAKNYYEKYNSLLIDRNFKTKDGINYDEDGIRLGEWITQQRRLYHANNLYVDRIELLNQIGMTWSIYDFSWEKNYSLAKNYYETFKNLDIPNDFKTKDGVTYNENGFSLGTWLIAQKQMYRGTKNRKITKDQILKLEKIGIIWNVNDYLWNSHYELAKKYFEHYGNLLIKNDFKTNDGINYSEDGIKLGGWINMQKRAYKGEGTCKINSDQIELLNKIGMVWNLKEYKWDYYYNLLENYFKYYGNLEIISNFKTKDGINYDKEGINLSNFIKYLREEYRNNDLTSEQIEKLNNIGMIWDSTNDYNWMKKYNLAKKYFESHNNLDISCDFITKDGINYDDNGIKLGSWIVSQRRIYKNLKNGYLTNEQIELLNKIGMIWTVNLSSKIKNAKNNTWMERYEIAKKFYENYNHLDVPTDFRTSDGINYDNKGFKLGKWINSQRQVYKGKSNYNMGEDHIKLLNNINIKWFTENIDFKLQNEKIIKRNKKEKEKEILNRFKTYLLQYDSNLLPSKEEINEGFVKYLK